MALSKVWNCDAPGLGLSSLTLLCVCLSIILSPESDHVVGQKERKSKDLTRL
ncbi:hypothetical protein ASPFODRAFT_50304, partial [Aspergillus luchuensis CBS 106.47]